MSPALTRNMPEICRSSITLRNAECTNNTVSEQRVEAGAFGLQLGKK
jgi:hypothetical protein